MEHAEILEYRLLAANTRAALMSLFSTGLRNTTLLQLVRLSTGLGQAFSVYAVYREDQMTFEVSAELVVARPNQSLQAVLRGLINDVDFLSSVLTPMQRQVDSHFASQRALGRSN